MHEMKGFLVCILNMGRMEIRIKKQLKAVKRKEVK
jgi:hypothetical protein